MTDRITKERVNELREWLHSVSEEIFNQPANSPQHGIVADLLALLSEAKPAPQTSGEQDAMVKLLDAMWEHYPVIEGEEGYVEPHYRAIRSLILSAPAPPTCGGEVERARMVLDTAIDLAYAYDLAEKDISDAYNEAKTALRYLLSILSAPKTVTREWVESYFEGGLVDTAIAMLRELGITVEDKSEGEDE